MIFINKKMKNKIKLSENKLNEIIKESVKKVLNEGSISQEICHIIDIACNNLDTEQILNYFCLQIGEYEFSDMLTRLLKNNDIDVPDFNRYEIDDEDDD